MQKVFFTYFLFLVWCSAFSQDTLSSVNVKDSTKFKAFIKSSRIELSARSVFISTVNQGALKDDQAWGIGAGLGFHTGKFRGFDFRVNGFLIQRIWSTDLTKPDPITLTPNRYEIGLFDFVHPGKYSGLFRLEYFLLHYQFRASSLQLGRMKLSTPFLNPRDGRLNYNMEEGAWLDFAEIKKWQISGGWIWKISPRSTTQWFNVGKSFGINSTGNNVDGTKSDYANNIQNCAGLGLLNVAYKPNDHWKFQVWDMLVDNVMNTAMLEINHERGAAIKWYQGFMYVRQDAVNNGGNSDPSKTYMSRGASANIFSGQMGLRNKKVNFSLNYTRITKDGRYLSPREWGREPFYTFMVRELNEGLGDVQALAIKTNYQFGNEGLKTGLSFGVFQLPDVKNYVLNKYGLPSYQQLNLDLAYRLKKQLKGLEARMTAAYKIGTGQTYGNLVYVDNKVNLLNVMITLDYKL